MKLIKNNHSRHCLALLLLFQASSVMAACLGYWNITLVPKTPFWNQGNCQRAGIRLNGPVGFVWQASGPLVNDTFSISLIEGGETVYKQFYADGVQKPDGEGEEGHEGQQDEEVQDTEEGNVLTLADTFGPTGRAGLSSYRVKISCGENGEKCIGILFWRVIDCGCPPGYFAVKQCTFDTVRGGRDAGCSAVDQKGSAFDDNDKGGRHLRGLTYQQRDSNTALP